MASFLRASTSGDRMGLGAEEQLQDTQARLQLAIRAGNVGLWDWDLRTGQVCFSAEWKKQLGYGEHEVENRLDEWERRLHPDDRTRVAATLRNCREKPWPDYQIEFRLQHRDGSYRWILACGAVVTGADEKPIRMLGAHVDITECKQAAGELRRVNRALRAINACRHVLVHADDEAELLQKTCERIVEVAGYRLAWVGLAEEDPGRTVRPVARAGCDQEYVDQVNVTWADNGRGRGPTGTAIRSARPVTSRDVASDPDYAAYRAEAIRRGLASSLALPLFADRRVAGALNVYSGEVDAFDAAEVDLLMGLADDLAYGMAALRTRAQRQQAEVALRQEKDRVRQYLKVAEVIFLAIDADQRVSLINPKGCRVLGCRAQEILGQNWFDTFVPPGARGDARSAFARMVTGDIRLVEYDESPILTRSGEARIIAWHNILIKDETGHIRGTLSSGEDITERQQAVEELRESEERFRETFEQAAVGIVHHTADGRLIRVNRRYCEILGYAENQLLGRPFWDFTHPDDLADNRKRMHELVEGRISSFSIDKRHIRKDGSTVWSNVLVAPAYGAKGELKYYIAVIKDISDRRQAEAHLADRTRELESLLNNVPDEIQRVDRQLRHIFVNRRLTEATGIPAEQWLGKTAREMGLPPDLCALWENALDEVFRTRAPRDIAFTLPGPAGPRHLQARLAPEVGADRQVNSVLSVSRDVTEQRRLEEKLNQAQKMEIVGQLAAGVAHDLNNVLTAVWGYASLLRQELPGGSRAIGLLEHLDEVAQQAGGVTKALLTFSHKTPTEMRPVKLGEIVSHTARLLQRMLPARIELLLEGLEGPPLWVAADATQLQQVLLNLTINARDAMPRGGELRIAVAVGQPPGGNGAGKAASAGTDWVALAVSDTGIGINSEVLPAIFEPFFTTKPPGQGTGLGLAIAKSIVEIHGGQISVTSEPGQGATFTVYLPRIAPAAGVESRSRPENEPRGHGETILLAEDNPEVREILSAGLRQAGFDVVQAADAREILSRFVQQPSRIRVLVLDLDLPKGSGLESLQKIRSIAPTVPAIIITGRIDRDIESELDEHSRLLRKPLRPAALVALVIELSKSPTGAGCPQ
jgi:PAS domain S-box-containing protein